MDKKLLAGFGLMSVMNLHQINSDTVMQIVAGLSLLQLITLIVRGSVFIDWLRLEGWKDKIPFYLIKCEKHGFQLSYPSGYSREIVCPNCLKEI